MRMLKIKCYFLFLLYALIAHSVSIAAPQLGVAVCYINEDQNNCIFRPPYIVQNATNINSIQFTFYDMNVPIGVYTDVNKENWGIHFSTGTVSNNFYCTQSNCSNGPSENVKVDANNKDVHIEAGTDNSKINHAVGTLTITMSNFASGQLPYQLQQLMTAAADGAVSVSVIYLSEDQSSNPNPNPQPTNPSIQPSIAGESQIYSWVSDIGTFLNPPKASALARFNGFVINLAPPDDLHSVKQEPSGAPTSLVDASDGHVTGYLLALWLARGLDGSSPCSSGGWNFGVNPISYSSVSGVVPVLTCGYTPYNEPVDGIGGKSDDLGCIASAPAIGTPPYLASSYISLTSVDIPAFFPTSKQDWLNTLIANPTQEQHLNACYTVVYVPISHTSYGKLGIANGEVYGYTAWALNAAYSPNDPTPNISLAHSNIGYITGTNADLASLDKDPALKLTTADCFIATAASNDINSKSVFYWRILRDEYLTPLGVTPYYYRYAPKLAQWLNEHPHYKPSINFILEKTGAFFYFGSLYTKKAVKNISDFLSNLFIQKAAAFELQDNEPLIESDHFEPDNFEADSADENTNEYAYNNNNHIQPSYDAEYEDFEKNIGFDFSFTGGVLFPSTDQKRYKKFYSHLTYDYELSSSAIFRFSNFAWSIGGKLNYGYNSQKFVEKILTDGSQTNIRNLYLSSIELISGFRYRNVNFLFLQPNIFVGAGVLRLREESKAEGDSGTNGAGDQNQIKGVTYFSPVFDFGANVDISLSTIFMYSERELALEHDVLLRLTAIYRINPSKALSASGFILNAGFAFLL